MKILSKSSNDTSKYGEILAKFLSGGEIIGLYGDLGGGKTQFTKGIAEGLGIKDNIISPTFVIRRDYGGKKLNLLHYDFYRSSPDTELIESLKEGISEENVTAIEWADKIEEYLPDEITKISFKYVSDDVREIVIAFNNENLEDKFKKEINL